MKYCNCQPLLLINSCQKTHLYRNLGVLISAEHRLSKCVGCGRIWNIFIEKHNLQWEWSSSEKIKL